MENPLCTDWINSCICYSAFITVAPGWHGCECGMMQWQCVWVWHAVLHLGSDGLLESCRRLQLRLFRFHLVLLCFASLPHECFVIPVLYAWREVYVCVHMCYFVFCLSVCHPFSLSLSLLSLSVCLSLSLSLRLCLCLSVCLSPSHPASLPLSLLFSVVVSLSPSPSFTLSIPSLSLSLICYPLPPPPLPLLSLPHRCPVQDLQICTWI